MPTRKTFRSRLAAVSLALALTLSAQVAAQSLRGYRPQDSKFSGEVRSAFTLIDPDAVNRARAATVTLRSGDDNLAAGTLFTTPDLPAGIPALIATKLSLLEAPFMIKLYDGRTFAGKLVAADDENDLAYVSIDAPEPPAELAPLDLSESSNILPPVGKFLATVDARESSVAGIGVVSTKPRPIPPASGFLGVLIAESESEVPGAVIREITNDSAAAKAGMLEGDIVVAFDGRSIGSRGELIDLLRAAGPNQTVMLQVYRAGQTVDLTVTLGSRAIEQTSRQARMARMGGEISSRRLGFQMVIQHDTFLRPNQMGTPLILLDGTPVAINIARAGRVETYALPLSLVRSRLPVALKSPPPELPPAEPTTKPATSPSTRP